MLYHECPDCGANLDPGEKCDCRTDRNKVEQVIDSLLLQFPKGHIIWQEMLAAARALADGKNAYNCPSCGKEITITPPQICDCQKENAATSAANTSDGQTAEPRPHNHHDNITAGLSSSNELDLIGDIPPLCDR